MRVRWYIEDGYVGKKRPHECEIDDEDLEGLSGAERENFIYECVMNEFQNKCSFY